MSRTRLGAFAEVTTAQRSLQILDGLDRRATNRVASDVRADARPLPGLSLSQSLSAADAHLVELNRREQERHELFLASDFSPGLIVLAVAGFIGMVSYAAYGAFIIISAGG